MPKNTKELNILEEKYKVLTETSPDCIKLFDINGNLLYINPGGLKEHGLKSLDEALKKNWQAADTLVDDDKLKFKKALKDAAKGIISTIEIRHTKKGADREACLEIIAPVKDKNKVIAIYGVSRDITESKRIVRELVKSKEDLEKELFLQNIITDSMSEGVYFVGLDDAIIKYTNPTFSKMFGYKSGEMVGKHASIVNAPTDKKPEETAREIMKIIRDTGGWRGEVRNIKKDGTFFWSYARASILNHPMYGKILLAIHGDITQKKEIEDKLVENELKYRTLFESSNDAIMTLEPPQWNFTGGNAAAIKMFGAKDLTDFISRAPWQYSPKNQPNGQPSSEEAKKMISIALNKGSNFFDWTHKRLNDEEFFATVLLSRIEIKNKNFLQATVRDVTEQKLAENKLKEKIQELQNINRIMIGREVKMIELKEEIGRLKNNKNKK